MRRSRKSSVAALSPPAVLLCAVPKTSAGARTVSSFAVWSTLAMVKPPKRSSSGTMPATPEALTPDAEKIDSIAVSIKVDYNREGISCFTNPSRPLLQSIPLRNYTRPKHQAPANAAPNVLYLGDLRHEVLD
jgi:hypothetical protein